MARTLCITGVAGFIGFHLAKSLLSPDLKVVGIDNLNDYYDPDLKKARISLLEEAGLSFICADLKDQAALEAIFSRYRPNEVVHLAAQAGVRFSIDHPEAYVDSNLVGFMNMLEVCRHYPVSHLIYASSSSVYGGNTLTPFSVSHPVDHPVSLYAATKKANELLAHTYSHLYGIPTTGLRFFTVYGPWGRPDMAYFTFTRDILAGRPIKVFNHGRMERDFTYIDDVIDAIVRLISLPPKPDPTWNQEQGEPGSSFAPYKVYNIGNNQPIPLLRFIAVLEDLIGKKADKIMLDMQPGDVLRTYADIGDLQKTIGFQPKTRIENGLARFVSWYREYYQV